MANNSWNQTLITAQTAGSALTSSTAATSILPASAKYTLPANYLFIGKKFRILASGIISTAASTPGTFTFDTRIGSVIWYTGPASGTVATSASNVGWDLRIDLTCLSIGASTSATMKGSGIFTSAALSTSTPIQILTPATGTGFDSTVSSVVDLFGTWSVSSASNTITLSQFELIDCN